MLFKVKCKKEKMKLLNLVVVSAMFVVFASFVVSAFGVSMTSSTFELQPGESIETTFTLDNYRDDATDVVVEMVVEEGEEYLALTGEATSFNLAKDSSVNIPVSVSVSQDSIVGDVFDVKVLFRPISGGSEGVEGDGTTIGFVMSQRKSISVAVVAPPAVAEESTPVAEKPQPSGSNIWIWAITGALIVVVIVVMVKRGRGGGAPREPSSPPKKEEMTEEEV
jgi:hypothetical protein